MPPRMILGRFFLLTRLADLVNLRLEARRLVRDRLIFATCGVSWNRCIE